MITNDDEIQELRMIGTIIRDGIMSTVVASSLPDAQESITGASLEEMTETLQGALPNDSSGKIVNPSVYVEGPEIEGRDPNRMYEGDLVIVTVPI